MHGKFAAAKVSTFVVSDFCVVWDFNCQRLCITPLLSKRPSQIIALSPVEVFRFCYVSCNINSALLLLVCLNIIVLGISTCCVPFGLICLLGWQRNVVCLRCKNGVQCTASTNMWPRAALGSIALPVDICPEPAIKWPMLPRKLICMWNPLSLSTIPFRSLPSGWDWIIVKAFQYRCW